MAQQLCKNVIVSIQDYDRNLKKGIKPELDYINSESLEKIYEINDMINNANSKNLDTIAESKSNKLSPYELNLILETYNILGKIKKIGDETDISETDISGTNVQEFINLKSEIYDESTWQAILVRKFSYEILENKFGSELLKFILKQFHPGNIDYLNPTIHNSIKDVERSAFMYSLTKSKDIFLNIIDKIEKILETKSINEMKNLFKQLSDQSKKFKIKKHQNILLYFTSLYLLIELSFNFLELIPEELIEPIEEKKKKIKN